MAKEVKKVAAKAPEEADVVVATEPKEAENVAAKVATRDSVTIRFRDGYGEPAERTYSVEEHGEDFEKLADEFKAKHATRLIKD